MKDFEGLLSSDYGFKPQGKSAPMAPAKSDSRYNSTIIYETGGAPKNSSFGSFLDDDDSLFQPSSSGNRKAQESSNLGGFDDIFGGAANSKPMGNPTVNLNSFFHGGAAESGSKFSSLPVFDKPIYDDEVFHGTSGLTSSSSSKYDDIFVSSSSTMKSDAFDDLLGGFGQKEPESKTWGARGAQRGTSHFDDLLQGFGGSTGLSDRSSSRSSRAKTMSVKKTSNAVDDSFVVLDSTSPTTSSPSVLYIDPLEQFSKLSASDKKKEESTSVNEGVFDDIDPLSGFGNSRPTVSSDKNDREKDGSPTRVSSTVSETEFFLVRSPAQAPKKKVAAADCEEFSHEVFGMPSVSTVSHRSVPNAGFHEANSQGDASPKSDDNVDSSEEIWLIVSEIPLLTEPTTAPPPSRPPPSRLNRSLKVGAGSYAPPYAKKKFEVRSPFPSSSACFQSPNSASVGLNTSFASPIDELEEFGMGRSQFNVDYDKDFPSGEDGEDANSDAAASAAAMKEAMEGAEAKFRHAKGVRERGNAKAARMQHESGKMSDVQEREYRETQQRPENERQHKESKEEERRMKEEEVRRRNEKVREEKEREQRRRERERILARQAVERATLEARKRAEKAAVEKAQAEARQCAERVAVQKVQSEARERAAKAAAVAKEKTEREAREKVKAEIKEKEAQERAAATAEASWQKNENDLDSFFGMGSSASSAPRPRATSSVSIGDFGEVERETEDRRRARLERHQRTQERAAKALAEKNQRDLEAQREQTERHRIAETLDVEIRRWSAGKEGNLRALLSTLQHVLWPECGWQPVSLNDLIIGASVKKVYRKATLCIHPDKVQQKGATLQQKYIAEKVFDLLKEAWNKFNSEELF